MPKRLPILDEISKSNQIIKYGFTGHVINNYELGLLSKYFHMQGHKDKTIYNMIIDFCKNEDEYFNPVIYQNMINKSIRKSKMYKLKSGTMNIPVYVSEIEKIKKLPHKLYRILFTMIVLARLQKFSTARIKEIKRKSHAYYLNMDFNFVLYFAGFSHPTEKESNRIKYELDGIRGFIETNLFSDKSFKLNFADDKGKHFMVITDINNITSFIQYFCVECGKEIVKSKKHDFCIECYKTYLNKIKLESKKRLVKNGES